MKLIYAYLAIINAVAFLLMHIDKQKARKRKRRIPERVLLGLAAVGGSLGTLVAMYAFRHKTKHTRFTSGVPLILFLHFAFLLWYLK